MADAVPNAGSMSGSQLISLSAGVARQSWPLMGVLVLIGTLISLMSFSVQSGAELDFNRLVWLTIASSVSGLFINTIITLIALDQMLGESRSLTALITVAVKKLPFLLIQLVLFSLAVLLGFGLLLVPGLILMITLLPASTLLTIRGYDPISTLGQSHQLVWGCWWLSANVYSLYSILALLALLPIGWAVGTISDVTFSIESLMQTISLTSAITTPMISAGLAVVNLVLCQELLMRRRSITLAEFIHNR